MNLTAKKKYPKENNGLQITQSNSKTSISPTKKNEKIIYLPKDFLKKNNLITTQINRTETNITMYNNSTRQNTTNPNSFRCQPNLLLYNKNCYKNPLMLNNVNKNNNVNNNTMVTHRKSPNTNVNVSTIEKDNSINSGNVNNTSVNNNSNSKKSNVNSGQIMSKVISFSKEKLQKIQLNKELIINNFSSEKNPKKENTRYLCPNMIYTRKRSKDGNDLRIGNNERRKLCKSAKEISSSKITENSALDTVLLTNNNSLLTSIQINNDIQDNLNKTQEEEINNHEEILIQDNSECNINNLGIDQKHKKSKSSKQCFGLLNQRVASAKDVTIEKENNESNNNNMNSNNNTKHESKNIHSIISNLSNKDKKITKKEETILTKVKNKMKNDSINNEKLLTLLKQNVEKMKELHKQQTNNTNNTTTINNNSSNNNNSNNTNLNKDTSILNQINLAEKQFKNISPSSSICFNKNNILKNDLTVNTSLNTEPYYKQMYSTPNYKTISNNKYYEEVSPKQIVCGNIISTPNTSKTNTNSSMKENQNMRNNFSIPVLTEKSRDSSYEYNYYVYSQVLNNNTNAKIKQNLKMASAMNVDKKIKNFPFNNGSLLSNTNKDIINNTHSNTNILNTNYDEAHLVTKNNIKDKLYNLEFNNNWKGNGASTETQHQQNNQKEQPKENNSKKTEEERGQQETLFNIKDKKYRLIYDYGRMAKEAKGNLYKETDPNIIEQLFDPSIHKKTQSFRDLKERKYISNEDEWAMHKKTNSVRLHQTETKQNKDSYYTVMTQIDKEKGNILKTQETYNSNNSNYELLSLTNRFQNKTNNVLSDVIARTTSKKFNVSSSLNNPVTISSVFNSRYKTNKSPN